MLDLAFLLRFSLFFFSQGFKLGREEVAVLGQVFGKSLKGLKLRACELERSFWPALWTHLPVLDHLTTESLSDTYVAGATSISDLSMFCSHASRPFDLSLGYYEDEDELQELRQCAALYGRPQVTVMG
jgi:hypothetical protein